MNFFVWCSTFQSKLNKLWKTIPKPSFLKAFCLFLVVFRSSFNFDWKVEHQTKKFEFQELSCFFRRPWCLQGCPPSGDITYFTFLFKIFWWWRHIPRFSFYWHLCLFGSEAMQFSQLSYAIWWLFQSWCAKNMINLVKIKPISPSVPSWLTKAKKANI